MSATTQPKATTAGLAMLATVAIGGCDTASSIDCGRVCDKYQDCVNPDYDVRACDDRCAQHGDSQALSDEIDACESCIDDKTCGEPAFDCDDECTGIVP